MIDKGNLLGSLGNRRRPRAMTRLWLAVLGRTVQEQTNSQQAGLLARLIRGTTLTSCAVHPLGSQISPPRCGLRYVPGPVARHHLPPVWDLDRSGPARTRHRAEWSEVVLGDPRRVVNAYQWEATYARWNQMPGYVARERSGVWQELTMLGLWKERNSPCAAG